jgi:hypothetical protein
LDVGRADDDSKPQPIGELAAERFVARGGGTQAVVQVSHPCDSELAMFGQFQQKMGKCNGVGPSGDAHEQARAGRAQGVTPDGAPDLLVQR